MAGIFITFEGIDKAGKTTQISLLQKRLEENGYQVVTTREPGGTPFSEHLRELVMQYKAEAICDNAELMLFAAARAQHLAGRIVPALQAGKVVLCDRFADSTMAYQGYGRGMDKEFIRQLNTFIIGDNGPHLTFLLELTVEESFARLKRVLSGHEADADRFEDEKERFHQRVRDGFRTLAAENPERIRRINASRTREEISEEIWQAVKPLLSNANPTK